MGITVFTPVKEVATKTSKAPRQRQAKRQDKDKQSAKTKTSKAPRQRQAKRQDKDKQSAKTKTSKAPRQRQAKRQDKDKQSAKTKTSKAPRQRQAKRQDKDKQSAKTKTSKAPRQRQAKRQDKDKQSAKTKTSKAFNQPEVSTGSVREIDYTSGTRHKKSGDMPVFIRGDHLSLGQTVPRAMPRVFAVDGANQKGKITGSGRLELARWLTRPDHPLTARVMANRIWQHLFGRGIVATPSNFGKLGTPPTHPELLDYLAVRLVGNGWSVKSLIREIMLSRAYQQASIATRKNVARDPDNRWFGRMNRKRLDAEALMDTLAWHSGAVKRNAHDAPGWKLVLSGRTLFGEFTRDKPQTTLDLFDGANPDLLTPRRADSTSAPQALFMLNNETVLNTATILAKKTIAESEDECERISLLYQRLFGRPASTEEQNAAAHIIRQSRETRRQLVAGGEEEIGTETNVWEDLCVALICSNEFLYVD